MKYHRRFKHFNKKTLRATEKLLKNWATNSEEENLRKMRNWLKDVSEIYQINFPMLQVVANAGAGCYSPQANKIFIKKLSVVTLLHEFRHALQAQGRAPQYVQGTPPEERGGFEDDARAWSLSLYFKVAPRTFKRLATENQIFFVTAEDVEN